MFIVIFCFNGQIGSQAFRTMYHAMRTYNHAKNITYIANHGWVVIVNNCGEIIHYYDNNHQEQEI